MFTLRETANPWLQTIATFVELTGVGAILIGGFIALIAFAKDMVGGVLWPDSYQRLRVNLGRAILLGLEFLVAADIIGTIAVTPTFESLGVLAIIILIRTILSFSLEIEITGRVPWKRAQD